MDDNLPIYMKPEDWQRSYEGKEAPHWAQDLAPSPLAIDLLKLMPQESNNKILEIGVGSGHDSIFFSQKGNDVTGIDVASGAIELAKKNAVDAGLENKINFVQARAEELPFTDSSFDAVYSLSVLHASILPESLAEIARVLRPGGRVTIYLYEMTESGGKKYWFWKKDQIKELCDKNKFVIDYEHEAWDDRHENEKTKILIFEMHKEG